MSSEAKDPASEVALEVRGLSLDYGDRLALDAIDLSVRSGEIFGVLGPNGGGKSTLFRVSSTLLPPTSGSVRVFGCDVVQEAARVRAQIGVVFQMPSLDAKLRVRENLEIHGQLHGMNDGDLQRRVDELLEDFGVAERANDRVDTLSGGLARRVEIAKGMLPRPRILLLDEPSTGLDPGARRELRELLHRLRDTTGTTIVWTTHLLDEAEACDRIAILDRGHVIASGTPRELKAELPGAVVLAELRSPENVLPRAAADFGVEPSLVAGKLHFAVASLGAAHDLAGRLSDQLAGSGAEGADDELLSVTVGRASLEDVFLARTGRSLSEDEVQAETKKGRRRGRGGKHA